MRFKLLNEFSRSMEIIMYFSFFNMLTGSYIDRPSEAKPLFHSGNEPYFIFYFLGFNTLLDLVC